MADTPTGLLNDFGKDTSDFEDSPSGPAASDAEGGQVGSLAEAGASDHSPGNDAGTLAEQIPAELAGTQFKTTQELVNGFKTLQRTVGQKDQQFKKLQTQVQGLVRQLAGQLNQKPASEVTTENADAFLKRFLQDPHGTLAATARELVRAQIAEHVEPRLNGITELQQDRKIDQFINGAGKDLTPEEQDRFLELLDENPWVSQSPDPLGAALKLLIADNPEVYAQRRKDARTAATGTLRDAKANAGLGGKRTSTQMGTKRRDEFDEVLDRQKTQSFRP